MATKAQTTKMIPAKTNDMTMIKKAISDMSKKVDNINKIVSDDMNKDKTEKAMEKKMSMPKGMSMSKAMPKGMPY